MALIREDIFPRDSLDPSLPTGLILCGMGGPDGPDAVRPFLRNLFKDPLIFSVPRLVSPLLGWAISTLRAPSVRARYQMMNAGCVSPQMETTRLQAVALARHLKSFGLVAEPGIAMRYWRPFPEQTVAELTRRGAKQFLVVPMYPQYSSATAGSTLTFVWQGIRESFPRAPIHMVTGWGLLPGFLHALAAPAVRQLAIWAEAGLPAPECGLVFVAHSLPQSLIDAGDFYQTRTLETVAAVQRMIVSSLTAAGKGSWLENLPGIADPRPAFQSKVGPIKWLGPKITDRVRDMAAGGCRRLMIQPVSFTCEHIETLIELDVELREEAAHQGITEFHRGSALNMDETWLKAMAAMLADQAFSTGVPHRA